MHASPLALAVSASSSPPGHAFDHLIAALTRALYSVVRFACTKPMSDHAQAALARALHHQGAVLPEPSGTLRSLRGDLAAAVRGLDAAAPGRPWWLALRGPCDLLLADLAAYLDTPREVVAARWRERLADAEAELAFALALAFDEVRAAFAAWEASPSEEAWAAFSRLAPAGLPQAVLAVQVAREQLARVSEVAA